MASSDTLRYLLESVFTARRRAVRRNERFKIRMRATNVLISLITVVMVSFLEDLPPPLTHTTPV